MLRIGATGDLLDLCTDALRGAVAARHSLWLCAKDLHDLPVVDVHAEHRDTRDEHRDELYDVFQELGCKPNIVEVHHGSAPQIERVDETHGTGVWGLVYDLIDTERKTMHRVGGYYHDRYERIDGAWKIRATRFRVVSVVALRYESEGDVKLLLAGNALPAPRQGD